MNPLWANDYHPSETGYNNISTLVANNIADPGSTNVVAFGDSWALSAFDNLDTALETKFGHAVNVVNAGVTGEQLYESNARFATDVTPYGPSVVVHFSGFANDLSHNRSMTQIVNDVREFVWKCWAIGARPVFLGVAPFDLVPTTAAAADVAIQALGITVI